MKGREGEWSPSDQPREGRRHILMKPAPPRLRSTQWLPIACKLRLKVPYPLFFLPLPFQPRSLLLHSCA